MSDSFGGLVNNQLELAVRREHCNWDVPLRQGHVYRDPAAGGAAVSQHGPHRRTASPAANRRRKIRRRPSLR